MQVPSANPRRRGVINREAVVLVRSPKSGPAGSTPATVATITRHTRNGFLCVDSRGLQYPQHQFSGTLNCRRCGEALGQKAIWHRQRKARDQDAAHEVVMSGREVTGNRLASQAGDTGSSPVARSILVALLKRYLDNHCANADCEGMSVLCECKLCRETRTALRMVIV